MQKGKGRKEKGKDWKFYYKKWFMKTLHGGKKSVRMHNIHLITTNFEE